MRLLGPPAEFTGEDIASRDYLDARRVRVVVDFGMNGGGEDHTAESTAAAEWAASGITILCVPDPAGTVDHSASDAALEDVRAVVTTVIPGQGFTIAAYAPAGTWGAYAFLCTA